MTFPPEHSLDIFFSTLVEFLEISWGIDGFAEKRVWGGYD